jgi:hypothetical protein
VHRGHQTSSPLQSRRWTVMSRSVLPGVSEPVATARQVRDELGLGREGPIPDLLRLVEEVAGVPITVLPLPAGVAGAYGREDDDAYIFVNSNTYPVRRRFTLAHELGHHALNHAPCRCAKLDGGAPPGAGRP